MVLYNSAEHTKSCFVKIPIGFVKIPMRKIKEYYTLAPLLQWLIRWCINMERRTKQPHHNTRKKKCHIRKKKLHTIFVWELILLRWISFRMMMRPNYQLMWSLTFLYILYKMQTLKNKPINDPKKNP